MILLINHWWINLRKCVLFTQSVLALGPDSSTLRKETTLHFAKMCPTLKNYDGNWGLASSPYFFRSEEITLLWYRAHIKENSQLIFGIDKHLHAYTNCPRGQANDQMEFVAELVILHELVLDLCNQPCGLSAILTRKGALNISKNVY